MRDSLERKMRRGAMVVAAFLTMLPSIAHAQGARTQFLADKLKSDDFRVRTNAALALGATNDPAAVEPLCRALDDPKEVVRQAAAVAHKRLGRASSLPCLKTHRSSERNDGVRVQIARAVESIEAAGGGSGGGSSDPGPPAVNPKAQYYVALSSVSNSTGRGQSDVDRLVVKAIRAKLEAAGTMQLAPSAESADAARGVLKKRKLKGFYLSVAVDKFDYSGGHLKVRVKVGVFTYPGKSLLGNVDRALTKEGVRSGDASAEDQLMELAAGLAAEQFAQNASAFL
jgi:hypothetical protein